MRVTGAKIATVTAELFGHARLVCGVREIEIELPSNADASDLASALFSAVPTLGGVVTDECGRRLMSSYTANLNGIAFLDDSSVSLSDGDRIFVFSSQAGG